MRKVLVAVFGACVLLLGVSAGVAKANSIRVCPSTTNPTCFSSNTLEEAVKSAQANSIITLGDGIYPGADIVITKNLTIRGTDPKQTIVQAAAAPCDSPHRVFTVIAARVTLESLTIRYGCSTTANGGGTGGGIWSAGTLHLKNVIVTQNHARVNTADAGAGALGGGIFSSGALSIQSSTIVDNRAEIISDTVASAYGGGIYNNGDAEIVNATIGQNVVSNNSVASAGEAVGGGIFNEGELELVFSTVARNAAKQTAGGLMNTGAMLLTNNLFTSNSADAGGAPGECVTVQSESQVVQDSTSTTSRACDTPIGPEFGVGDLATYTILPVYPANMDSASIDYSKCAKIDLAFDQVGIRRYQGKACDLGAVESGATYLPVLEALPDLPDLVVREIVVEPSNLDTNTRATIKVVIENAGSKATVGGFWVDLYINPVQTPPLYAGTNWNMLCRTAGCKGDEGIMWLAPPTLLPGESFVLTSDLKDNLYLYRPITQWDEYFAEGTIQLWAFVDSYGGAGNPSGLISERNETNNLLGPIQIKVQRGLNAAGAE